MVCCHSCLPVRQEKTSGDSKIDRQQYDYFIAILDSAITNSSSDTIDCCSDAIRFMEMTTSIEASSPGNFFGKFYFLRKDYIRWKNWGDTTRILKK